jgi:HD-GYP domain-containing protein (c-di-GMP phosphodiesterase class II)
MQSHVNVGVETIRSVRTRVSGAEYLKMAEEIAGGHHEWYNGAGYPKKCTGEDIPLSARIVALADVYDALATKRPYKPAFSHAEAVQIITKSSGLQFDPAVVDAFRKREQQFAVLALELSDHSASSDDDASVPGPVSTVQPEDDHEETECYSLTPL